MSPGLAKFCDNKTMRKRGFIAIFVFVFVASACAIPTAIGYAIVDIYLSGHSILDISAVQIFPGMDASNFIFIVAVIFSGFLASLLYWRLSRPK